MVAILMGVAGSGKSTLGRAVADRLGWAFLDADDLHGATQRARMGRGLPLTERDRDAWLGQLAARVAQWRRQRVHAVLACSALRRRHRERLHIGAPDVRLVYLKGDAETLAQRLAGRRGHFFDPALLGSQLETLEEPACAFEVDIRAPIDALTARIAAFLEAAAAEPAR